MTEGTHARAFWTVEPGRGEIRAAPLRSLEPGEVLVQALRSGISRGTESLVFRGLVPASQWTAMRCPFHEGEFPGPVKYGYPRSGASCRVLRNCRGCASSVCTHGALAAA